MATPEKSDFELGCERGFLPIEGTRVRISGTRHNGQWGVVVERPRGWSRRSIAVLLDEWIEPLKFYRHNLFTEYEMEF